MSESFYNIESIIDLLKELGCDKIRSHKNNTQILTNCPYSFSTHGEGTDNNPSFNVYVSPYEVTAFCFGCHKHGQLRWIVEEINTLSGGKYKNAVDKARVIFKNDLKAKVAMCKEDFYRKYVFKKPKDSKQRAAFSMKEIEPFIGKVPRYIVNRGINLDILKNRLVGYDKQNQRVVFPVFDINKQLVGLVGRDITGQALSKYYNYWNFEKSKYLYGEDVLDPISSKTVFCVEGIIDSLRMYTAGFKNVVAILGTAPSKTQIEKLLNFGFTKVIVAMDNDEAGKKAEQEFEYYLKHRVILIKVVMPEGKDPGDLTDIELKELFSKEHEVVL